MREISKNRDIKWLELARPLSIIVEFYRTKGFNIYDIPDYDIGEVVGKTKVISRPIKTKIFKRG